MECVLADDWTGNGGRIMFLAAMCSFATCTWAMYTSRVLLTTLEYTDVLFFAHIDNEVDTPIDTCVGRYCI